MIRSRSALTVNLALVLLLLVAVSAASALRNVAPPAEAELKATVEALTGPGMDGRRSGSAGGDLAAERLAEWLKAAGLQPGGERGSFFQSFVVTTRPFSR